MRQREGECMFLIMMQKEYEASVARAWAKHEALKIRAQEKATRLNRPYEEVYEEMKSDLRNEVCRRITARDKVSLERKMRGEE